MIYFRCAADCPDRVDLALMTREETAAWAARASSHATEVSRRAQVQAFYGLTRAQEARLWDDEWAKRYAAAKQDKQA